MKVVIDKTSKLVKYISENAAFNEGILTVDNIKVLDGDTMEIAEVLDTTGIIPLKFFLVGGLFTINPDYKENPFLPKEKTTIIQHIE